MTPKVNYKITKAGIVGPTGGKYDLLAEGAIFMMEFFESIHSPLISGFIVVTEDYQNALRAKIPDLNEASFNITFKSEYTNISCPEVSLELDVQKISNLVQVSEKNMGYKISLISKTHLLNSKSRIRKSYRGKNSKIVNDICDAMLGKAVKDITPTSKEQKYVFPNWSPIKTINYLSTMAYSAEKQPDASYVFYEDRDGFHYVTLTHMIEQNNKNLDYVYKLAKPMAAASDEEMSKPTIVSIHQIQVLDHVENDMSGFYGTTLLTHDAVRDIIGTAELTYDENFKNLRTLGSEGLSSKEKREQPVKSVFQYMGVDGKGTDGPYKDVETWVQQGFMHDRHLRNSRYEIIVSGDTRLLVGHLINIELKYVNTNGKEVRNDKESGSYLITNIRHILQNSKYQQIVEIIRDGTRRGSKTKDVSNSMGRAI